MKQKFKYVIYCYILKLAYLVSNFGLLVVERSRNKPIFVRTGLRDFRILKIVVAKNPVHLLILKILRRQKISKLCTDAINRVSTQQTTNGKKCQNRITRF